MQGRISNALPGQVSAAMALIIDGYNLLHASGILARGVGPGTLERARGALLGFLAESLTAEAIRQTTVVFDARSAPPGLPRQIQHQGLKVHFAPNPGDADELIERLILADHSPRRLVVVSSDHRLQRAAKRRGARPIDSILWYQEVLRERLARQQARPTDGPKPAAPLTETEVEAWLQAFGLEPAAATREGTGGTGARPAPTEPPPARTAELGTAEKNSSKPDPSAAKTSGDCGKKPRASAGGDDPFPPGFGDEIDPDALDRDDFRGPRKR